MPFCENWVCKDKACLICCLSNDVKNCVHSANEELEIGWNYALNIAINCIEMKLIRSNKSCEVESIWCSKKVIVVPVISKDGS